MKDAAQSEISKEILTFRLPRYEEIPNVGLYLEQTAKYINEYIAPLQEAEITGSMISNYVKKKLVANPIKKQYNRDQIASLLFISLMKSVLSLDNLGTLLALQEEECHNSQLAYNYFCTELEQILRCVFGSEDSIDVLPSGATQAQMLLHNANITVAHKIYLNKSFAALQEHQNTTSSLS